MAQGLEGSLLLLLVAGLFIFWPYIGGWKVYTEHSDVAYDPELIAFLCFAGFSLQLFIGWRIHEWYYNHSGWYAWAIAIWLYIIVSVLRLLLHSVATSAEQNDEENQNASLR